MLHQLAVFSHTCQPAVQQRCVNMEFLSCNFYDLTWLDQIGGFILEQRNTKLEYILNIFFMFQYIIRTFDSTVIPHISW
jgi:hypothetical protein